MEFPRWMYRQDVEKGRIFYTPEQLKEAGEGWFDSPAFLYQEPPKRPRGRPPKVQPDAIQDGKDGKASGT